MSFLTEKEAMLQIVKDNDCNAAQRLYNNLNAYSDIPTQLFKYTKTFDGDNAYFDEIAAVWDDAGLVSAGVYYLKTGITITNPKVVAKSTGIIIEINAGGQYGPLEINNLSEIDEIIISGGTHLDYIAISGGSSVTKITIESGSSVGVIMVKNTNSLDSSLGTVVSDAEFEVFVDEGAEFGGFECQYIPL